MIFILQWIDSIWLPLAYLTVHPGQRLWAFITIISCMIMMRLMIELMVSIGYPTGILPWMTMHVFYRGLALYSLIYALYLIFAAHTPENKGPIFMAGSISIFFTASFLYALIMVL